MTPDELRRIDNDLCIIYEKGLKPIKDEKYYYFETPMIKKLSEVTLNHLEFEVGDRGKWRKFNPYNPYVEGEENKPKDLKIDSIDDLFEENNEQAENAKPEAKVENSKIERNSETSKEDDAPVLPQNLEDEPEEKEESTRNEEDIMSVDVQKELEAKFDELFGSFDDEDNK